MPVLSNAKHEAVAQAFIADPERIGWKAYKAVYPDASQRAAENGWSRLMKNGEFSARVDELSESVAEKTVEKASVTAQMVIDELAKLGFSNMLDYMAIGPDGQPFMDFSKLTRDQAAAIQEIVVETRPDPLAAPVDEDQEPQGHGGSLRRRRTRQDLAVPEILKVRFKLADKRAALVDLGKHLGLFKQQVEHDVTDPLKQLLQQISGTAFRPVDAGK